MAGDIQNLFLPNYACWLNLIEPWWKQLRSLALKGRRFEHVKSVEHGPRPAISGMRHARARIPTRPDFEEALMAVPADCWGLARVL